MDSKPPPPPPRRRDERLEPSRDELPTLPKIAPLEAAPMTAEPAAASAAEAPIEPAERTESAGPSVAPVVSSPPQDSPPLGTWDLLRQRRWLIAAAVVGTFSISAVSARLLRVNVERGQAHASQEPVTAWQPAAPPEAASPATQTPPEPAAALPVTTEAASAPAGESPPAAESPAPAEEEATPAPAKRRAKWRPTPRQPAKKHYNPTEI